MENNKFLIAIFPNAVTCADRRVFVERVVRFIFKHSLETILGKFTNSAPRKA